jgi:hypothetical protein
MARIALEKRVVGIRLLSNRERQPRRRPRIWLKQNASQVARTPGAVRGEGFIRVCVAFAGAFVPLDGGVESLRIEGVEPRTKPRQFARGKLFDSFFEVFDSSHVRNIAFGREP